MLDVKFIMEPVRSAITGRNAASWQRESAAWCGLLHSLHTGGERSTTATQRRITVDASCILSSVMAASDVLVLGCASAGKTSLVRGLMQTEASLPGSYTPHLDTASTTGVEVDYVHGLSLREVGSPLRSMWHTYLPAARAIMYVVDVSSPMFLAEACVDLLELVAYVCDHCPTQPFLLVLNKSDDLGADSSAAVAAVQQHLLLQHCAAVLPQIVYATVSARTAAGLGEVHSWLRSLRPVR